LVAGLGALDYYCAMLIGRNDVSKHLFAIPGWTFPGNASSEWRCCKGSGAKCERVRVTVQDDVQMRSQNSLKVRRITKIFLVLMLRL
jgi:hypothetical protein